MVILKLSIREAEYRSVLVWSKSCWRRPRASSTISTMTWNFAMIANFLGDEVKHHNISELNMNRGNTDSNLLLLKCQQKKSLACGFGSPPAARRPLWKTCIRWQAQWQFGKQMEERRRTYVHLFGENAQNFEEEGALCSTRSVRNMHLRF